MTITTEDGFAAGIVISVPMLVGAKGSNRVVVNVGPRAWQFGVREKPKEVAFVMEGEFSLDELVVMVEMVLADDAKAKTVDKIVKKLACGMAILLARHGYLQREPGDDVPQK